jgi:DNA polymerase/3'-5' exonuclease PolX
MITNKELSEQFFELGSYIKNHQETSQDVFRAGANFRVASILSSLKKPVAKLSQGEIEAIEGIGASSAKKIVEAVTSKNGIIPALKGFRKKYASKAKIPEGANPFFAVLKLNKAKLIKVKKEKIWKVTAKMAKKNQKKFFQMIPGVTLREGKNFLAGELKIELKLI